MKSGYSALRKYVRAANYLSAAQIYLWDNVLLKEPLKASHIKPRLLGHWGTCPGINFAYAHLNRVIKKNSLKMMFILGPGHGFPALQANLFIEGTLKKYYPEAEHTEVGMSHIASKFSFPYGYPSHSNPGTPGVILEGGELGYSLSTAYGAVLDNPDLIAACLIGDGEAETGSIGAAWPLHKLISTRTNGFVLPILHLNGYKISGPTLFGRMSDSDLVSLFSGYGYGPEIADAGEADADSDYPHEKMAAALDKAVEKIKKEIEFRKKDKSRDEVWRPPLIILRSPKGWSGIKELNGGKIEGNFLSHQVVAKEAKNDVSDRKSLEDWLVSYRFNELFDPEKGFCGEIKELIPDEPYRMGEVPQILSAAAGKKLILPSASEFAEDASVPGTVGSSSMRRAGLYLKRVFELNRDSKNFRLFSPDETYSNKLDAVFEETARAFALEIFPWDKDLKEDGRVLEVLSENSLQGMLQGYTLTGRHGVFASYEAFIQIVSSMVDQYVKFLRGASEISWRRSVPPINFILTSSGWRQEHNGFSHQNPGFIGNMIQKPGNFVNVYFPPDGNSMLAVLEKCLSSTNSVNVIVAGKTQEPRYLTTELAKKELESGIFIWDFASDKDPDLVFCAAGDYLTKEALAAISLLKRHAPESKLRFVNIMQISSEGFGKGEPDRFSDYFTVDKPVIINFHGYPETIKQLMLAAGDGKRFSIHGYIEHGSTTTPFDMHVRNETSRYHLVIDAAERMLKSGAMDSAKGERIIGDCRKKIVEHVEYIKKNGVDLPEIESWTWQKTSL